MYAWMYWLGIEQAPYKALFGIESCLGMERLNLPEEEQNKIKTAQQLYAVLSGLSVEEKNKKSNSFFTIG